jgi:hypothetical protein
MRLLEPKLAVAGLPPIHVAHEWPHYASFVLITSYDVVAITPVRGWMHVDILRLIRDDVRSRTKFAFEFANSDVILGFIEWDEDGERTIRTTGGQGLPSVLDDEMNELLSRLEADRT